MPKLPVPIADLTAVYACYLLLPLLRCKNVLTECVLMRVLTFGPIIRRIFTYPNRKSTYEVTLVNTSAVVLQVSTPSPADIPTEAAFS